MSVTEPKDDADGEERVVTVSRRSHCILVDVPQTSAGKADSLVSVLADHDVNHKLATAHFVLLQLFHFVFDDGADIV